MLLKFDAALKGIILKTMNRRRVLCEGRALPLRSWSSDMGRAIFADKGLGVSSCGFWDPVA